MSSSFGGGGQGAIRYVIQVDDSQAVQKLQSVGQQFTALGNSTAQASQKMLTETEKVNQAIKNNQITLEQYNLSQKSFSSVLKDSVLGIGLFASGIVGLISQYTSLQRAQNTLQRGQLAYRQLQLNITKQQEKVNQTIAKYGEGSAEAAKEIEKLNIMQGKAVQQSEKLEIQQQQLNQRTTEFYIQIIPSVIQAGAGLFDTVLNVKKWLDAKKAAEAAGLAVKGVGINMKTALIGTGIGAVLVALGTALVAFTQNWYGFRDAVNAAGVALGNFGGGILRPVLMGLQSFGNMLTGLLGGDIPQTATAATEALGTLNPEVIQLGQNVGLTAEAAEKAADAIEDFWDEARKGENIKAALDIEIDKSKITDKILDYLPDSVSKDIKIKIEGNESIQTAKDSFAEILALATQNVELPDDEMDEIVKAWIKYLAEKLPDAPGSDELQGALADTLSGDDTQTKVRELINSWNLLVDPNVVVGTKNISFEMDEKDWEDAGLPEGSGPSGDTGGGGDGGGGGGLLAKLEKALTEGIPKVINNAVAELTKTENWINAINAAGAFGASVATAVWNFISAPLTDFAVNYIDPAVAAFLDPASWVNAINAVGAGLSIVGEAIWNFIQAGITSLVEDPAGTITKVADAVKTGLEGAFAAVASVDWAGIGNSILTGIGDWFSTNFPQTSTAITDMVSGIANGIKTEIEKLPQAMLDLGTALVKGMVDAAMKAPEQLAGLVTWLLEEVKKKLGFLGGIIPSNFGVPGTPGDFNVYSDVLGRVSPSIDPNTGKPIDGGGGGGTGAGSGTDFENKRISDDKKGSDPFGFGSMVDAAKKAFTIINMMWDQLVVAKIADGAAAIATHWSSTMNSFGKNAKSGASQIVDAMNEMTATVQSLFKTLGKDWSKTNNQFGKNAASGKEQIVNEMNEMTATTQSLFGTLADNWSSTCQSFINNAEAAADGVNKALGKIKDVNVNVRIGLSGPGVPFKEHLI